MGCGASKPGATATVSPLTSPAHARQLVQPVKALVTRKQEDEELKEETKPEPSSPAPVTAEAESAAPAPLTMKIEEEKTEDDEEPGRKDSTSLLPADAPVRGSVSGEAATEKHHHHRHHHHHKRHSSVSQSARKASLHHATTLPVDPKAGDSDRASLSVALSTSNPSSSPTHTRKLSGHHRSRSYSVVGPDGVVHRQSTANLLDAGADSKDQMMANQLKTRVNVNVSEAEQKAAEASKLARNPTYHTSSRASVMVAVPSTPGATAGAESDDKGDKGEKHGKKKKEKLIKTLELEDLHHMSAENLEHLWKQYDKDKNGTLDRKELKRLAKDCIGRTIAMCEEEIRRQQPKLSESELKAAVEKELKFVLPGAAKENGKKEDVQKEMVRRLVRKLDVNGDGDLTRAEFMATWNVFAGELFKMQAAESQGAACVVM